MTNSEATENLLRELKKLDVGPPEIPQWTGSKSDKLGLRTKVDLVIPLFMATVKCRMMRPVIAFVLGSAGLAFSATRVPLHSGNANFGQTLMMFGVVGLFLWKLASGLFNFCTPPFLEVNTPAGFYGELSNKVNKRIHEALQGFLSTFEPTPYLGTGELCTFLPFLWNTDRGSTLRYERVWVDADDGERFAIDWVFPPGGYVPGRPVVVLLTGLAPTQHWTEAGGFVSDTAWHVSTQLNMTAVVLVARGTMDTAVKENLFNGARVSDLHSALFVAETALKKVAELGSFRESPIFGAGFSMGAILLANYCGRYVGEDCRLKGAVHFSGVHDATLNMHFEYSKQTWQAYLAYSVKTRFCTGRFLEEAKKRGVDTAKVLSRHSSSVIDLDRDFVAAYNGYEDVYGYYRDMSLGSYDKWRGVTIPVLAVAARDDPITHCDSLRAQELSSGNKNLLFLITEKGGHVGWPWGMKPWQRAWDFSNNVIGTYIEAVLSA
eukprot:TRINITY_DN6721_c0_g4_i1.p1 TRINITY_DN6721_c0_g4~~TRINITY_DN6721_c0_g4_i1.p1  ORF type:complete len:491 (-),score=58.38 TRINITY_DN6721_c0_g4_i1:868-2340(-)